MVILLQFQWSSWSLNKRKNFFLFFFFGLKKHSQIRHFFWTSCKLTIFNWFCSMIQKMPSIVYYTTFFRHNVMKTLEHTHTFEENLQLWYNRQVYIVWIDIDDDNDEHRFQCVYAHETPHVEFGSICFIYLFIHMVWPFYIHYILPYVFQNRCVLRVYIRYIVIGNFWWYRS